MHQVEHPKSRHKGIQLAFEPNELRPPEGDDKTTWHEVEKITGWHPETEDIDWEWVDES